MRFSRSFSLNRNFADDFCRYGGGVSFLYAGDMGRLVQILSQGNIHDLTVAEPDLEEIFMHYYAAEEENNDNHQA